MITQYFDEVFGDFMLSDANEELTPNQKKQMKYSMILILYMHRHKKVNEIYVDQLKAHVPDASEQQANQMGAGNQAASFGHHGSFELVRHPIYETTKRGCIDLLFANAIENYYFLRIALKMEARLASTNKRVVDIKAPGQSYHFVMKNGETEEILKEDGGVDGAHEEAKVPEEVEGSGGRGNPEDAGNIDIKNETERVRLYNFYHL